MSKADEIRARDRAMIEAEIARRGVEIDARQAEARAAARERSFASIMVDTYKPRSTTARHTAGQR